MKMDLTNNKEHERTMLAYQEKIREYAIPYLLTELFATQQDIKTRAVIEDFEGIILPLKKEHAVIYEILHKPDIIKGMYINELMRKNRKLLSEKPLNEPLKSLEKKKFYLPC